MAYHVAFRQKQLGQVRSILSGDSGDESYFAALGGRLGVHSADLRSKAGECYPSRWPRNEVAIRQTMKVRVRWWDPGGDHGFMSACASASPAPD
jgi:hypothetical protein